MPDLLSSKRIQVAAIKVRRVLKGLGEPKYGDQNKGFLIFEQSVGTWSP